MRDMLEEFNGRILRADRDVHPSGPFDEGMRAWDPLPLHDSERDALVRGPAPG